MWWFCNSSVGCKSWFQVWVVDAHFYNSIKSTNIKFWKQSKKLTQKNKENQSIDIFGKKNYEKIF